MDRPQPVVIDNITALSAWIEAALPPADPGRYEPWQVTPAEGAALTAEIRIYVESPGYAPRALTVTLTARPFTDRPQGTGSSVACSAEENPHES